MEYSFKNANDVRKAIFDLTNALTASPNFKKIQRELAGKTDEYSKNVYSANFEANAEMTDKRGYDKQRRRQVKIEVTMTSEHLDDEPDTEDEEETPEDEET